MRAKLASAKFRRVTVGIKLSGVSSVNGKSLQPNRRSAGLNRGEMVRPKSEKSGVTMPRFKTILIVERTE
jgi:hypothetical protein